MLAANAAGVFGFGLPRLTGTLPGPARMRRRADPAEVQPAYRGDLDRPLIGA